MMTGEYWWRVVYSDDDNDSDDSDDDDSCPPADLVANNYVPTKCYSDLGYCTEPTINASSDCCYATVLAFSLAVRIDSMCLLY